MATCAAEALDLGQELGEAVEQVLPDEVGRDALDRGELQPAATFQITGDQLQIRSGADALAIVATRAP